MGKLHKKEMRHTAGFQQYIAWLRLVYVVLNGETAGGYGVLFSLRAFSMALSMDLRYSRFSLVAPYAHTSLRCLS